MKTNYPSEIAGSPSDGLSPWRGGITDPFSSPSSESPRIESWQMLAERLRQEIAEYGQLLSLLERQQRLILRVATACALEAGQAIEDQVRQIAQERRSRDKAFADFALAHAMPASSALRSLLPCFPAETRPFFRALVSEITVLIHRVRRHSSRNRRLQHRGCWPDGMHRPIPAGSLPPDCRDRA